MNSLESRLRPSRIWYAVGVALIVAGVVGGPFWLVRNLIPLSSSGESFLAPCEITFSLESPGRYVLWHEAETFFEGTWYSSSPELPHGTTIKVLNHQRGDELILTSSLGTTESVGRATKHSICSFWVEKAGEYTIEISGLESPRVFSLRESIAKTVLLTLIQGGMIFLMGGLGGAGLIVYTALKRNKTKERLELHRG
ncbi:MAG: hypothetical protein GTN74_04355 [Proteobacteria bacterium]|nr:hypothetical protein [Pseudomonadota bacterium]NIS68584.1 hypothetical protein [Pseudomonadota bacterium]